MVFQMSKKEEKIANCTKNVEECGLYKYKYKSYPHVECPINCGKSSYTQNYPHYPHGKYVD